MDSSLAVPFVDEAASFVLVFRSDAPKIAAYASVVSDVAVVFFFPAFGAVFRALLTPLLWTLPLFTLVAFDDGWAVADSSPPAASNRAERLGAILTNDENDAIGTTGRKA